MLFDLIFKRLNLCIVFVNHREVGLNDCPVGSTEREFCKELSPIWAEQFSIVGIVGTFEDCSDAIFLGCSLINKPLAGTDEISRSKSDII